MGARKSVQARGTALGQGPSVGLSRGCLGEPKPDPGCWCGAKASATPIKPGEVMGGRGQVRLGRVDVATSLHFLPEASSCWRLLSRDTS